MLGQTQGKRSDIFSPGSGFYKCLTPGNSAELPLLVRMALNGVG